MSTTSDLVTLPLPNVSSSDQVSDNYSKKGADKLLPEKDIESAASVGEDGDDDHVISDYRDLITHVISVEDDPTLNCWTFRVLVIGIGLSAFGGVLGMS